MERELLLLVLGPLPALSPAASRRAAHPHFVPRQARARKCLLNGNEGSFRLRYLLSLARFDGIGDSAIRNRSRCRVVNRFWAQGPPTLDEWDRGRGKTGVNVWGKTALP